MKVQRQKCDCGKGGTKVDDELLLSLIAQFGYAAFFFSLCLGLIGLPIPNEVVVMTGGALSSDGTLAATPVFLATYLGVSSGLTFGYGMGRFVGTPVVDRLRRKAKIERVLTFAERLMAKYGSLALGIGYFLPLVRHVMPYMFGLHKASFKRYALIAYPTAFLWTGLYFFLGRTIGNHLQAIGGAVYDFGLRLLWHYRKVHKSEHL